MNISTAFPSAYLKGVELEGDTTYTITELKEESVGQGRDAKMKPVLYFEETDKGLVLNKTNANTITTLYGAETDEWVGKQITLYEAEVEYQGKMTPGIRIRSKRPAAAASTPSKAKPTPVAKDDHKVEAWASFVESLNEYEKGHPDDKLAAGARVELFNRLMGELFPGLDMKKYDDGHWTRAQEEIMAKFDAGTKTFLPF